MNRRHAAAAACLLALTALGLSRPAAAQLVGDRTEATNCASAVKGDVTNSVVNVVCGIPYEKFSEYMVLAVSNRPGDYAELLHRLDALVPATSRVRVQAIAHFFAILREADVPPEHLEAKLIEIAERYQNLLGRMGRKPRDDPATIKLTTQARKALVQGEFDHADALLTKLQKDQDKAADQQALQAAETRAQRARIALSRLRYKEAAVLFAEAAERLPARDWYQIKRYRYLNDEAEALYAQGGTGDNAALLAAIERCRALLRLPLRKEAPRLWAITQVNLGLALWLKGDGEAGTRRLEEALAAFRAALVVRLGQMVPALRLTEPRQRYGTAQARGYLLSAPDH
jgi:tetratricopeptide (TPR) repeat protein